MKLQILRRRKFRTGEKYANTAGSKAEKDTSHAGRSKRSRMEACGRRNQQQHTYTVEKGDCGVCEYRKKGVRKRRMVLMNLRRKTTLKEPKFDLFWGKYWRFRRQNHGPDTTLKRCLKSWKNNQSTSKGRGRRKRNCPADVIDEFVPEVWNISEDEAEAALAQLEKRVVFIQYGSLKKNLLLQILQS